MRRVAPRRCAESKESGCCLKTAAFNAELALTRQSAWGMVRHLRFRYRRQVSPGLRRPHPPEHAQMLSTALLTR